MAHVIRAFATGVAAWEQRDETTRDRWSQTVIEELPLRALARYEEQVTRLAGEFPEFAFWAHRVGVQAILGQVGAAASATAQLQDSLRAATELLASAARGPDPARLRADLTARYRDQVAKPVAGVATDNIPEGVQFPALCDLYVNPSYKAVQLTRMSGVEQLSDPRWQETAAQRDLSAMVLDFLLSTEAAQLPLVLLGQPGAGKSAFTQMLAAGLDPRDYLVVRVELRAVPSDTGIQEQVEAAIENLTGRVISWPDLAESAGDAQPVVILDGFDELLQASGVSHADYLERIQAFQDREAGLGRPVAVLLTSRTAVASQVRYPDGTPVARLEEFDPGQVGNWLSTWNQANPGRPLAPETALAQGDLGRQPLLLFLLAFFHSGGGDLDPGISQASLYERLFTSFVERDVRKLAAGLGERDQRRAVQRDLDHLSMVAFAMFNRGRQSVTETDLVADLAALQDNQPAASWPAARAAALSIAEQLAGRFFFKLLVQRDQMLHGQQSVRSTYEFLHASFGEFLVARWVVTELSRLGEQARRAADDLNPPPPDDAKLHALLSVTVLSTREQRVLSFITDLLSEKEPGELAVLRVMTGQLFRACLQPRSRDPYPQYRPTARTAPALYAAHSANLVLLLLLIGAVQARTTQQDDLAVLPGSEVAVRTQPVRDLGWHSQLSVTRLWHSQLTRGEWESLLRVVRVHPGPDGGLDDLAIGRWTDGDYQVEMSASEVLSSESRFNILDDVPIQLESAVGMRFRESALLGSYGYQDACETLLPYIEALGSSGNVTAFQTGPAAAVMLGLLMPAPSIGPSARAALYKTLFALLPGIRAARLLLDQLRRDIRHMPVTHPGTRLAIPVVAAAPFAWANINAYLDVLSEAKKTAADQRAALQVTADELGDLGQTGAALFIRRRDPDSPGDLMSLASASPLIALLAYSPLNDGIRPRDLHDLLRLPPNTDPDPREVLGIYEIPELIRLIGVLDLIGADDPLEPLDLRDLSDLSDPGSSLAHIALWTGLTRRELTDEPPPPALRASDAARLASIAPDFARQAHRLASERGLPNPLPLP